MSAKDNFAQAMKELLNGEVDTAEKEEKKPAASSSFSPFSQPEPKRPADLPVEEPSAEAVSYEVREVFESVAVSETAFPVAPAPAPAPVPTPVPAPSPDLNFAPASFAHAADNYTSAPSSPAPAAFAAPVATVGNGETTVIAQGTTLVGDIATAGGLRVGGNIKGNVKVASMMELNGKVIGDIEASDAVIIGSIIRGNVTVSNVLTMDGDTTIIGDVSAKNVDVNGKIKGNLTVEERGHFQNNAVLVGNLMSGTVIIDEGVTLKGDISITSAQTEDVSVEDPDFDFE